MVRHSFNEASTRLNSPLGLPSRPPLSATSGLPRMNHCAQAMQNKRQDNNHQDEHRNLNDDH